MKATTLIPVLLAGVGIGWALATLAPTTPESRTTAVAVPTPAAVPEAGSASPAPSGRALLQGRAARPPAPSAPSDPSERATPGDGASETLDFLPAEDRETWADEPAWTRNQEGLLALLTLHALAGRLQPFLQAADLALKAGIDAPALLDRLRRFPPALAAVALDRLREAHADLEFAPADVAQIYLQAGDHDRAFALLLPKVEEKGDVGLALLLVQADPGRAARVIGAITQAMPWSADALATIGSAFVDEGRPDLALPFLNDALQSDPSNGPALEALVKADPDEARQRARQLAEGSPAAEVWNQLARLEKEAGHTEAAVDAWRESLARSPTNDALFGIMAIDPEQAYEAGRDLARESTDDEFMGAVAKAALKSDHEREAFDLLLRAHSEDPGDSEWMRAMIALEPERAATVLSRDAAGTNNDELVGAYGNALLRLGRAQEAYDHFAEAHQLDPGDWEWQRGMARADPRRALPVLEALRKSGDRSGPLLGAIADAEAALGRRAEALAGYVQAAESDGPSWFGRMALLDAPRALESVRRLLDDHPDDAQLWAALGDVQEAAGRRAAARDAYDHARTLAPTTFDYEIAWRRLKD